MIQLTLVDSQGNIKFNYPKSKLTHEDYLKYFPLMATQEVFSEVLEGTIHIRTITTNMSTHRISWIEKANLFLISQGLEKFEEELACVYLECFHLKSFEDLPKFMEKLKESDFFYLKCIEFLCVSRDVYNTVNSMFSHIFSQHFSNKAIGFITVGNKLLVKANHQEIEIPEDLILVLCLSSKFNEHGVVSCNGVEFDIAKRELASNINCILLLPQTENISLDIGAFVNALMKNNFTDFKLLEFSSYFNILEQTRLQMNKFVCTFPGLVYFIYRKDYKTVIPDLNSVYNQGCSNVQATLKYFILTLTKDCRKVCYKRDDLGLWFVYEKLLIQPPSPNQKNRRKISFSSSQGNVPSNNDSFNEEYYSNSFSECWSVWLSLVPVRNIFSQAKSLVSMVEDIF